MFYSETYKTHWWGPPRIASRALMAIPTKLGFTDNKDGHSLTVINPEWDVVYPIRNPYSRAVSWWNLRHNDRENLLKGTHISFEEFVKNPENEYFHIQPGRPWEPINTIERNNLKVRNIIRYEHLVDDLLEIDFVKDEALAEFKVAETAFEPDLSNSAEYTGDETVPVIVFNPVAVTLKTCVTL